MIFHGGSFEYNSTGVTFAPMDGVTSIEYSGNKVDTVDTTSFSTTGITRTFEGGLEDSGEYTVKANYTPGNASQVAVIGKKDGKAHDWKVVYAGALGSEAFSGIITSVERSYPDDKECVLTIKIKVSGAITIA